MASVSKEDRPLFSHDWTARQEYKLLESIDEYGYGNWYVLMNGFRSIKIYIIMYTFTFIHPC